MTQSADRPAEMAPHPPFAMRRTCPSSPPREYAELRREQPVSRATLKVNGRPTWLVTRHEHVRRLLSDARVSSNPKLPGHPHQLPVPEQTLQQMRPMLLSMDPPDHTAQRRMLIPEFTARRVREMRPRVQEIVDERIDAMLAAGRPVDTIDIRRTEAREHLAFGYGIHQCTRRQSGPGGAGGGLRHPAAQDPRSETGRDDGPVALQGRRRGVRRPRADRGLVTPCSPPAGASTVRGVTLRGAADRPGRRRGAAGAGWRWPAAPHNR